MTIKVNERFEFYRDTRDWKLIEWIDGKDKDGNPKKRQDQTHHGSLLQICSAIIDRSAGDACDGIKSVVEAVHGAKKDLLIALHGGNWSGCKTRYRQYEDHYKGNANGKL